ncbi:penicillin acylase family protein [Nocardioides sp.]|uniref:penicillin acylase family protein n=1 Tax=Nocardioides sp. TaxID=35761 RepID=UPI00356B0C2D
MARIYRDAHGVPHIRGTSVLDVVWGQGWASAQDRAWQLEYLRRRATGTAAEVLGRAFVDWDVLARRTLMSETGQRAFANLDGTTREFVTAYVEGLNAGLGADAPEFAALGIEPQPWEPWTPLAVFHAQHLLFAVLPDKLWRHRAFTELGQDAQFLARDGAINNGSNVWAVGPSRTASGVPLIGGDPHRTIESPGVYAQVRLANEGPEDPFDVVGFAFPGVPGVQHFAQTETVAWAITNACADYQDVYDESLDAVVTSREEQIAIRGEAPVNVEVASTPRGPLFHIDRERGRGLSVRDAAAVLGDLGFDCLVPLLLSRTVSDVDRALDGWVAPGNNVVIADRRRVRFRNAGRIPVRPEGHRRGIVASNDPDGDWSGWVDLPGYDISGDGHVVSANEHRGPESLPIGTTFAPRHRAERLNALLEGRRDFRPADFEMLHNDTLDGGADTMVAVIAGLDPGPAGRAVQGAITSWDRRMDADSAGAAAFAAWRSALTRRVVAEPVFAGLLDSSVYGPVFAPYLDLTASVGLALETLLAADQPFGIDLCALATAALEDAAGHPATWGATHVFSPTHAFDLGGAGLLAPEIPAAPVDGDYDCVRCTGSLPGVRDDCYRGSVARYVWDLSEEGRASAWVVPMGASGDPRNPHHTDQLDDWVAGRLLPIVTDWAALSPVSEVPPRAGAAEGA